MELSQIWGWGVSLETDAGEGPQKAVCLLGSLFTFLRVILALGRGAERGGGGQHVVGACQWSTGQPAQWRHLDMWVVHKNTHRHRPPADQSLKLVSVFVLINYLPALVITHFIKGQLTST